MYNLNELNDKFIICPSNVKKQILDEMNRFAKYVNKQRIWVQNKLFFYYIIFKKYIDKFKNCGIIVLFINNI